jgi:tetratricopeptide (TPR) repeat protein
MNQQVLSLEAGPFNLGAPKNQNFGQFFLSTSPNPIVSVDPYQGRSSEETYSNLGYFQQNGENRLGSLSYLFPLKTQFGYTFQNYSNAYSFRSHFRKVLQPFEAMDALYLDTMKINETFKIKEENGDYREAIDLYNKATRYFMENKVASFGIVHELDKFTYIKEKGTGGLINYAAEMYTEQDDLDKGLILYKLLLSRNYDVKLLEGSLYTIGYKYGLKEKNANPGFKAKELVKQYTSNDKKMKRFEKGFAKGYKN